jgi:hypothetical protein
VAKCHLYSSLDRTDYRVSLSRKRKKVKAFKKYFIHSPVYLTKDSIASITQNQTMGLVNNEVEGT